MRVSRGKHFLVLTALIFWGAGNAAAQIEADREFWPSVKANIELRAKTRLQVFGETQNGEDFPYLQWKVGAILSYRMKRILRPHDEDIDEENQHTLVIGAGYEYLQTLQNDETKKENRMIIQATPRYHPAARIVLQDRNRVEFRWVDGAFSARYRNKLTAQRPFTANGFRFTPYASGELFYDGKHHSWNENQYAFGVQLPYKKRLMLDTYYLRQNCTTCSEQHINVLGVTLNLYFKR